MVMQEQAPPTTEEPTPPTETPGSPVGDGEEAPAREPETLDSLLERFNPEQLIAHPKLSEVVKAREQKAADRTRSQVAAETRRKYGDPEIVRDAVLGILKESGIDEFSRSQQDRVNTLLATFEARSADTIAAEIPRVFFSRYELSQETLNDYQEKVADKDFDGAFQALVDGAVAVKDAAREAAYDRRVKDAAGKLAKAELETAAGANGTKPLPATSRGVSAGGAAHALTTAEIDRMPASVWVRLPDEVKDELRANVQGADADRGAQTVDMARIQSVATLAKR